jgi:hypothetical protein
VEGLPCQARRVGLRSACAAVDVDVDVVATWVAAEVPGASRREAVELARGPLLPLPLHGGDHAPPLRRAVARRLAVGDVGPRGPSSRGMRRGFPAPRVRRSTRSPCGAGS